MKKFFVKHQLNKVGKGMCLAKWTHTTTHLGLGTTHSCHHCAPHQIPVEEIKIDVAAIHNTKFKKSQRKIMLEGERPSECSYCHLIEDTSKNYSDRIIMSAKKESWPYYKKITNTAWEENFDPTNFEVSFSNVCNFSCAYCSPTFSSKWVGEIESQGDYPLTEKYNSIYLKQIPNRETNPYIDAFWEYLSTIYNSLITLRVTGGEPLLDKNLFRLLDYIIANPRKDLTLIINTNLGIDDSVLDKFIEKCKIVEQYLKRLEIATSGESVNQKANYIRYGLDYTKWLYNCEKILKLMPKTKINFMSTYNCFAVTSFTDFLKDIHILKKKYRRIDLSVSYVSTPSFMSPHMVPKEWKYYLDESLDYLRKNFSSKAADRFKHAIVQFESQTPTDQQKKDFYNFILEYDRRRGTDFISIFPEYQQLLSDYSKY